MGIFDILSLANSGSALAANGTALVGNLWNLIQSVLPH